MIKMRKSLRSTLKIAWLTLAWALVFPLLAQASAKDGEAEVYEGKTATIYLGTPYQNTLRKSKVISYAWYSESDSYVTVTSSTQNYARIKGIRATSSCKVYFKCSYSLDGYYRTMDFYYEVKVLASSISVTRISLSHSTANLTEGNTLLAEQRRLGSFRKLERIGDRTGGRYGDYHMPDGGWQRMLRRLPYHGGGWHPRAYHLG